MLWAKQFDLVEYRSHVVLHVVSSATWLKSASLSSFVAVTRPTLRVVVHSVWFVIWLKHVSLPAFVMERRFILRDVDGADDDGTGRT